MRAIWILPIFILFHCSVINREPSQQRLTLDASGYLYDPKDRSCDGFPKLKVETMPGTCLGLVMPQSRATGGEPKKKFIMPRTIVQIPGTKEFLVVDMGGWKANNGALYWMKPDTNGDYQLQAVKTGLNTPHGLSYSADGFLYLGETQSISRFRFVNGKVEGWTTVISNLPRFKGHMHPLTQFTFDPRNGDMFINSGAPSDHCYQKGNNNYESCPETERGGMGAIYRVPAEQLKNPPPGGITKFEHTASGLRNSMAMVVHSSGYLVQGENSRDFPEQEEPYEEINVVAPDQRGFHYGWPYCYNAHAVSPEWEFAENRNHRLRAAFPNPVKCAAGNAKEPGEYQAPHALMPPHVAPLHMAYYQKESLPLKGQLLVSWHGYQPAGQRLVAYNVDEMGRPQTMGALGNEIYDVNPKAGCAAKKPFRPKGGLDGIAPYREVISGWSEVKGERPKGAPVGFTVAEDGSIFLVEDRSNRTVVRLARGEPYMSGCGREGEPRINLPDPKVELLAWRNFLKNNPGALSGYETIRGEVVKKYCASCHAGFQEKDIALDRFAELDYLVKNEWLIPGNANESKLYQALAQTGEFPPMPPGGSPQFQTKEEEARAVRAVNQWINGLPTEMNKTYQRLTMKDARKVRNIPSVEGSIACGQYSAGDVVYMDPRPETKVRASGWLWMKTYVVPGDSRIFQGQCQYPEDGVFYVAEKKI